jgi:hypothetical protein
MLPPVQRSVVREPPLAAQRWPHTSAKSSQQPVDT